MSKCEVIGRLRTDVLILAQSLGDRVEQYGDGVGGEELAPDRDKDDLGAVRISLGDRGGERTRGLAATRTPPTDTTVQSLTFLPPLATGTRTERDGSVGNAVAGRKQHTHLSGPWSARARVSAPARSGARPGQHR